MDFYVDKCHVAWFEEELDSFITNNKNFYSIHISACGYLRFEVALTFNKWLKHLKTHTP